MTVVYDLDIEKYHADRDSISKTGLDLIDKCPAIFRAWQSPDAPARVAKPGQLEGSLAHCAVLEPEEFDRRYMVGPSVNRNTKVWKEFVESLAPGVTAIQADQRETAMRQAESVRALPEIREALSNGRAEVSAYWTDPETGVQCRCRPDFVNAVDTQRVLLLDLKTFTDSSPQEFARQVARKAYAKQAAYYSDGYELASDKKVLAFIFVAVSTEFPYLACASMLDEEGVEAGRRHYQRNLETYAHCKRTDTWPGYSNSVEIISLPQWALNQE